MLPLRVLLNRIGYSIAYAHVMGDYMTDSLQSVRICYAVWCKKFINVWWSRECVCESHSFLSTDWHTESILCYMLLFAFVAVINVLPLRPSYVENFFSLFAHPRDSFGSLHLTVNAYNVSIHLFGFSLFSAVFLGKQSSIAWPSI